MTVRQLLDNTSSYELTEWKALFNIKAAEKPQTKSKGTDTMGQ